MKHGYYDFRAGKWMPIKCPICGNADFEYESYGEFGIGTVERHGYCDKCGYAVEQAYSPVYEGFCALKRGWKGYDGVYHEKNYKRHRRVRRKHLDRVKRVDQSLVVKYI